MNKSNVAEFVSGLTKAEFGAFGSYLSSEYFGFPKRIGKLYEIFKARFFSGIEFDKTKILAREEIGKIIYDKTDLKTDANVRKLLSEFNSALEKFYIQTEFEKESLRNNMLLLRYYNKKGSTRKLESRFKESLKYINENARRDEYYYEALEGMYKELSLSRRINDIVHYDDSLKNYVDYLNLSFVENKLFTFQVLLSKQFVNRKDLGYEWAFYVEIMTWADQHIEVIKKDHPEIYLKFNELRFQLNPALANIIEDSIKYIEEKIGIKHLDLTSYFEDLINLCSQKIAEGDASYEKFVFKMARVIDENKLFGKILKINYILYKTIIDSCIGCDMAWGEYFAEKYADYLSPEYRMSAPNLMLAKINLFKKDYYKARIYESKIDYKDFIHFTDGKGILARIEYETENYTESLMALETLEKYLVSNKDIPTFWTASYKSFSDFMKKLIRIKESFEIKEAAFEIQRLEKEINSFEGFVYAKEWLITKLGNLK